MHTTKPPDGELFFGVTTTDTAVVLSVAGEIDMLTAPQLRAQLGALQLHSSSAVIVDLSRVDFLTSAGIGALVQGRDAVSPIAYVIVADGYATRRPMQLLGLHEEIDIYPTLSAALEGVQRSATMAG
jgi:anti-sigma B factor antagonist